MASKTSICNQAMFHLKNSKSFTNVDTDSSIQATVVLAFYDDALREMLEEFDWSFAKVIADLALVEEDPDDGAEWAFSYRWPSNCVKARYIVDGNLQPSFQSPRIPFEEGADATGRTILTNEEDAVLAYTKAITDVTIMSTRFRNALGYKIAHKAAPTLCGDDRAGLGQRALQNYYLELSAAKALDLNQRRRDNPRESEFIEGR